jgi:hypothetical protein
MPWILRKARSLDLLREASRNGRDECPLHGVLRKGVTVNADRFESAWSTLWYFWGILGSPWTGRVYTPAEHGYTWAEIQALINSNIEERS